MLTRPLPSDQDGDSATIRKFEAVGPVHRFIAHHKIPLQNSSLLQPQFDLFSDEATTMEE